MTDEKANTVRYNTGFLHGAYNTLNFLWYLIDQNKPMTKGEMMNLLLEIKSSVGMLDNQAENIAYDVQLVVNQHLRVYQLDLLETDLDSDFIGYASFD